MPQSKGANSKFKKEWIHTAGILTVALLILSVGVWFALSFTETRTASENPDQMRKNSSPSDLLFTNRTKQMINAYSEKQKLLSMEEDMDRKRSKRKKYTSVRSDPDRESTYRAWRKRKEQTEKYYSRFKDDDTTDPNSVKVQMQKSLESLEKDRPIR